MDCRIYVNTTCTLNDVTYVNCYFGYYEYDIVENGTQGVDAGCLAMKSYYVAA